MPTMPSRKVAVSKVHKFRSNKKESEGHGQVLGKAGDDASEQTWSDRDRTSVPAFNASSLGEGFDRARVLREENYWLKEYFDRKIYMFNYDMKMRPKNIAGKNKNLDAATLKLEKFLDSPAPELKSQATDENNVTVGVPGKIFTTQRERINKFIDDAWNELLLLRVGIGYWSDAIPYATLLDPNRCRYRDVMGVESLFYRHGLDVQSLTLLPPEQAKRYVKQEILLSEKSGDFYKVFKIERTGFGIGRSAVQAILRVASQIEDMEYGEHSYSFAGKLKFRHHKVGHEIKSGNMAGKSTHFWTKKRGDAIRKIFEGKIGFIGDYISNFDHLLEVFHEAIAYYEDKKWTSPERRLVQWGGPMAMMIISKADHPFVSQMLRAEASWWRNKFNLWISPILVDAFKMPVDAIELTWSDSIFFETKVHTDNAKAGMMNGALSQETWRMATGFNDPSEVQRKTDEVAAAEKDWKMFAPGYDTAHGPYAFQEASIKQKGSKGNAATSQKPNGRPAAASKTK